MILCSADSAMASSISVTAPNAIGAGESAGNTTQEQLNIQSLFEHDDAHDDIDATEHANLMQTSSAQHVSEDKGSAHDMQIPTLADEPSGRQFLDLNLVGSLSTEEAA